MGKMIPIGPLSSAFMITSMVGFLVSTIYIYDLKDASGVVYTWAPKFGSAFALVFVLMFIASILSMTYCPIEDELQIDHKRKTQRTRR